MASDLAASDLLASAFPRSGFAASVRAVSGFVAGRETNLAGYSALARTVSDRVGGSGTATFAGETEAVVRAAGGTVWTGSIGRAARAGTGGTAAGAAWTDAAWTDAA